ncbi:hypothetical protein, partial [Mycoplasmopsis bovis]|uniref:hypothetical protein n=1 Tax=Mycoplasmopsis bovis TaxID=28903 RepID=UPI003D2B5001
MHIKLTISKSFLSEINTSTFDFNDFAESLKVAKKPVLLLKGNWPDKVLSMQNNWINYKTGFL